MALHHVLFLQVSTHPFLYVLLLPIVLLSLPILYRLSPLHPLSHIPSSFVPRISSLWLTSKAWAGTECSSVHALHEKHGPIVRTGPASVDIADGAALHTIYVDKGGFRKAGFYANFDIDGHATIFSELDSANRAPRAKAVIKLFSTQSLRANKDVIYECVDLFVSRLKQASKYKGQKVNVLNLTRGLAVDTVTAYLFKQRYGGLDEDQAEKDAVSNEVKEKKHGEMSASGMVNSFVAVGRWWYLSGWAFQALEWLDAKLHTDPEVGKSMEVVDTFVSKIVEKAKTEEKTDPNPSYPARLLAAGFTEREARSQCTDLIFAGTDSTGMNLGTICFFLSKHPEKYAKLRKEILDAKPSEGQLASLPYLKGVINESLRLSLANPSRLPRVVPRGGWTFNSTFVPQGTIVSCTPYELHLNPAVFPNPLYFEPERWLEPTDEMNRDLIAFGLGPRQCIARNLASMELYCAVQRLVEEDVLAGARCLVDKIEILEWFNSKVVGERIELVWD